MSGRFKDKRANRFALRMALVALAVGFGVHALIWGWGMGLANLFNPNLLLPMLGPALLPAFVAGIMIAASDTYDDWFWIGAIAALVFVFQQVVFWIWRSTINDSLGYSFFLMMPILSGFPLALISYGVADALRERETGGV